MKLIESVKAVPKTSIISIAKPIGSFLLGVILAGSRILGEDSVLTASAVAALPLVCGFSALLGALLTAIFTEMTAGKVASLTAAIIVLLTRFLFDGTSRRRYPGIVSAVAAASYLGCAIFAGIAAGASAADYIRLITVGAILAASTYLTTTVSRTGIFDATTPQLLALFALAEAVASSYHLGEILSFLTCAIWVYKLTMRKETLSSAARCASLKLSFLESALAHFPKFVNPGQGERSFENMVELISLTESDLRNSLTLKKSSPKISHLCGILSKKIGADVVGNPLPDGAAELYFPKTARVSESMIAKAAEKAGIGSGCELFRSESDSYIRYTIAPKPRWYFDSGICQLPADSAEQDGVCGDCAEVWSFGNYSHMLLSDGMGTGRDAGTVARNLVRAFRSLIEGGYSLESALRLSSEYIRSCQPEESFATLDILSANLMTGEITIRKCGAGKSYILRGGSVTPIPQGGYPIGILGEISLMSTTINPESDMTILMMTDGADGIGIEKLAEIAADEDKLPPGDLAALITSEAHRSQKENYRDDITVAAIRISKIL
ncbi:MAG: serine/threonine-protein phosphatase [Oscillospiraceae bacterium]|nr:serine/threonine-protein phosphatase [Oscillospiraceae bacterium]